MRSLRIMGLSLVATAIVMLGTVVPQAQAASLPSFPMALPFQWGAAAQAGGSHGFAGSVRSSIDFGASNNVSIPVVAAADGVISVGGANGYSRCYVTITHADGWQSMYYHLRAIPTGLSDGDRVVAGETLGMTAMPGSETCGRGSFRHVHFTLKRNGVEQPINGLSLGGYTVHDGSRAYCGHVSRDSDGTIVADARRTCAARPSVANNVLNPATLADRGAAVAPNRGSERPEVADRDTISAAALYVTDGEHTVNGRAWRTACEPYSQTKRCRTEIWSVQALYEGARFAMVEGWVFNNLTYVESSRGMWAGNPLGNHDDTGWTAEDGRRWKTECDTETTGRNGCRSYAWATTASGTARAGGGYRFSTNDGWVFNNMVRFSA